MFAEARAKRSGVSTVKGQWRLAVAICAVAANVAGCGAPDLAAMRPTVHKPAVLVEIVGSPPLRRLRPNWERQVPRRWRWCTYLGTHGGRKRRRSLRGAD